MENRIIRDKIVEEASHIFDVPTEKILGRKRNDEYIKPRHSCIMVLFYVFKLSKSESGRLMNRDHSNVIHVLKNFPNRFKFEVGLAQQYEKLKRYAESLLESEKLITDDRLLEHGFEYTQAHDIIKYNFLRLTHIQLIKSNDGYWYPSVIEDAEMGYEESQMVSLNGIKYWWELERLWLVVYGEDLKK